MARLPDDEIQRRYEAAFAEIEPTVTPEMVLEKWGHLPAEQREVRRRQAVKAMARHATIVDDETGQRLLGGKQPSNEDRLKRSVVETIASLADGERQQEIIDAMFAPLARTEPAAVRGKQAREIVKLTIEHREMERRDRDELRKLGRDEMIARLARGLMGSDMAGDLLQRMVQAKEAAERRRALPAVYDAIDVNGSSEDVFS